jgi:regulator of sigma E protease
VELTVLRNGTSTTLPAVNPAQVEVFLKSPNDYVGVMTTRVEQTAPDSPAEQAGLQSGDLVYEVNDTVVTLDTPLGDLVQQEAGEELTLTVLRDGGLMASQLTPRVDPPAGQGALGVQIGPMSTFATMPFFQSVWQGVVNTFSYIGLVLELPVRLIMGTMSAEAAQLSGPVGIAREVGGAVNSSISYGVLWPILRLSAVLSAALAITNLLPLPALDGGRLLFIFIEWIRGKRVSPEREGMVHMIGFMLLLSLMLIITVRDIAAPHATIDWGMILGQ